MVLEVTLLPMNLVPTNVLQRTKYQQSTDPEEQELLLAAVFAAFLLHDGVDDVASRNSLVRDPLVTADHPDEDVRQRMLWL